MFATSCRPYETENIDLEPIRASQDYSDGDFRSALMRTQRVLEAMPHHAWMWRFKGDCLIALECPEAACEAYDQAIALAGPGTEDTVLWKALAEQQAGRLDAARSTLERYLATGADRHHVDIASKAEKTLLALRA